MREADEPLTNNTNPTPNRVSIFMLIHWIPPPPGIIDRKKERNTGKMKVGKKERQQKVSKNDEIRLVWEGITYQSQESDDIKTKVKSS